jgi:hypothetical protein
LKDGKKQTTKDRDEFRTRIFGKYSEFLETEHGNDSELTSLFRFERAILNTKNYVSANGNKGLFLAVGNLLDGSDECTRYTTGGHSSKKSKRRMLLIESICDIKPRERDAPLTPNNGTAPYEVVDLCHDEENDKATDHPFPISSATVSASTDQSYSAGLQMFPVPSVAISTSIPISFGEVQNLTNGDVGSVIAFTHVILSENPHCCYINLGIIKSDAGQNRFHVQRLTMSDPMSHEKSVIEETIQIIEICRKRILMNGPNMMKLTLRDSHSRGKSFSN